MSNDEFYFKSDKQEEWLRSIYALVGVLFTFNLAFAIFNIIKYIWPMQQRSTLIILFYSIVLVLCTSHLIFCICMSIHPDLDPFIYDTKGVHTHEFAEWIGSASLLALGWLVTATMYQLTVSIRVIFNLITV